MTAHDTRAKIRAIVEPTLHRMGYDLVGVELVSGRRLTLRLSIDAPGGVGIEDCRHVSHRLGPVLDEADPIASSYDLEVSSPGIERPLERLLDFRRFVGFRARIVMVETCTRRRYTGTIDAVEGATVCVVVDGVRHELDAELIDRAHLVLDLAAYEEVGKVPWPPDAPVQPSEPPPAVDHAPPAEGADASPPEDGA